MKIALIKNNKVDNIIIADMEFANTLSGLAIDVTNIKAGVGWIYNLDGTFSHPNTLLTQEELDAKEVLEEIALELLKDEKLSVVIPIGIVHTINAPVSAAFLINALGGANTFAMSNLDLAIGKSGIIIIKNPSSGAISFNQLPAYMKTPSGADINFVVDVNAISIISYFIIDANTVICNYIGDLK